MNRVSKSLAVALIGVQHWPEIRSGSLVFAGRAALERDRVLLLSSFAVLAGCPVLEELLRTVRTRSVHVGLATIR